MNFTEFEILTGKLLKKGFEKSLKSPVNVHHQRTFKSLTGNNYNVDIALSYKIMGLEYLTLVECKYWNTRVSREKVGYLKSVLNDLKANNAIVVSKKGFQKGAIKYAQSENITLIQINKNNKIIVILLCIYVTNYPIDKAIVISIVDCACQNNRKELILLNNTFKTEIVYN